MSRSAPPASHSESASSATAAAPAPRPPSKQLTKAFLKSAKPVMSRALAGAAVFHSMAGAFIIAQAYFLVCVLHDLGFKELPLLEIYPDLIAMAACLLGRFLAQTTGDLLAHAAARQGKAYVRQRYFQHILTTPAYSQAQPTAEMLTHLIDGVEALQKYFAQFVPAMVTTLFIPLAVLAVVTPFDWRATLILCLTAPCIPFFMILIGKGTAKQNQKQWRTLARLGNLVQDMILGLPTLKIFGASKQEIANLHTLNRAYRTSTMKVLRMAFLSSFVLEFFATVSIALIAVFVGFRLMWGEMSYFDGLFVLLLAPEFYAPIRRVGVMYHMRMEAYAAIEHMAAALADAPTTPPHTASLTESAPIPAPQGLDLRDVCYRYPGQHDDTVCNISLSLRTGQVHALIGPSGAGKTTLARLILGVLPATHGEITLHPSTTAASTAPLPLTPDIIPAYMPHVAYVPQTPTIFDGTIAENIAIGRTLDMAAIEKAAQKAHLHATIIALPDGYQTPLAESGKNFSGGQVQRLALARAFYRDAAIIVLDEPTAHLDHRTEQDILAVLDNAKTSAAILMIAHRLHTLDHADCVSFVQNGQLIAQGAHTTLRETNAAYQNFIRFMDAQSRTGDAS